MQWLAGITGAGIAAGTGLLKWGKFAGKGKTVIKAGDHIIQGTPGMPRLVQQKQLDSVSLK